MSTKSTEGPTRFRRLARASLAAMMILALLAPVAGAQVYYMYPGAPAVKKDEPAVGVNIGFGDKLFRMLGYARFNVNAHSDLGIEVVADNADTYQADVWRGGLGADYKYVIVPKDTELPFDLAVQGGFGFQKGGDMTNIDIPLGGLLSRPVELKNEHVLVPYGGVYLLIQYASWDLPAGFIGDDSDWDLDVELRIGTGYEINDKAMAYANLFVGSGTKFYLGFNYLL